RDKYSVAALTNDIFTREDAEFLVRHNALPTERIRAIETGGCPHAAIREDISANLGALEELHAIFNTQLLLIESGGDNLAANYSRELADFIIYGWLKFIANKAYAQYRIFAQNALIIATE